MIINYYWDTDDVIKEQLSNLIMQNNITPVIGSGFTRGCKAFKGNVPSGEDMSEYLRDFASRVYKKDKKEYENSTFTELCTYYGKKINQ